MNDISRELQMVDCVEGFSPQFRGWLLENAAVWKAFEDAARKVHLRRSDYSAFVIVNVLRWRSDVEGIAFKMSNDRVPDLARLYNICNGKLFNVKKRFGKSFQ